MDKALSALDQIGKKVGVCAALFVAYLYFQMQDIKKDIERLDRTTSDLAEVKQDISAINAKLQIILDDYSSKKYILKSGHAN
jgi:hypothetical protein